MVARQYAWETAGGREGVLLVWVETPPSIENHDHVCRTNTLVVMIHLGNPNTNVNPA